MDEWKDIHQHSNTPSILPLSGRDGLSPVVRTAGFILTAGGNAHRAGLFPAF